MLPDPILTLGPLKVHMYGLMIAVGVLCAFVLMQVLSKKKNLDPRFVDFLFYTSVVSTMAAFGSAVLFQAIYDFIQDPGKHETFFGYLGDGMTFIGGLIGALIVFLLAYVIFRKKLTGRLVDFLPILPCCITIAHAFGRVGCFFAGCCYGIHSDTCLDVQFPKLAESALPTQLYEAVFLFLLFGVLLFLLMKKNLIYTMSVYLISYGVFRFAIEFVRADERGSFIGALTPSQFWSVVMVLAGVLLIVIMKKGRKPCWAAGSAAGPDDVPSDPGPETESGVCGSDDEKPLAEEEPYGQPDVPEEPETRSDEQPDVPEEPENGLDPEYESKKEQTDE